MNAPTVAELFQQAHDEGDISPDALDALTFTDVGAQLQGQIGLAGLDLQTREIIQVAALLDDSSSIRFAGNSQAMRDGFNLVMDELAKSRQADSILVYTDRLNAGVLNEWVLLRDATRLNPSNYNPSGYTPLYDRSMVLGGSSLAVMQQAKLNGQIARAGLLITGDGHDEGSQKADATNVRTLFTDLLMTEQFLIAGLGVDDAPKQCPNCYYDFAKRNEAVPLDCPSCHRRMQRTDFYEVFSGHSWEAVEAARTAGTLVDLPPIGGMGIWPKLCLTPKSDPKDIRRAFNTFSSSMVRASQGANAFSQTVGGGFTV